MKKMNDDIYYKFASDILEALHLKSKTFYDDVKNQKSYEVQIFKWINELYQQEKNSKEAIQDIHRKRLTALACIDISPKL
ncbi:hypothetical protein GCM10022393_37390 [Aquimarina addita]|uniref:Uncharacterized protein n=1 Tax=Aquimarina addita TaxID=870485 RepID=A0ABP6USE4_9FLAO